MSNGPFERDDGIDTPGLIGARWWQVSVVDASHTELPTRRSALTTVLVVGAALAGIGMFISLAAGDDDDDGPKPTPLAKPALEIQKDYGWNFGARSENLTFDGQTTVAFEPASIAKLADDLMPASPRYRPYWSPTLFQAPGAMPTKTAEADSAEPFKALKDVLVPIYNIFMGFAFSRGRALALLLAKTPDVAVVVDLPGPEAVAFAAGMAGVFDPVFTFDNWPHPRGVVPAHRTLAAALYYQPLFKKKRAESNGKPPVFVLDRDRLTPYVDETKQFDNRWTAKLPAGSNLSQLGIKKILYVTPAASDTKEMDDVNDELVSYAASKLDVRMVGASTFIPCKGKEVNVATDEVTTEPYCYAGGPESDPQFFLDYPWVESPGVPKNVGAYSTASRDWRPKPRVTPHSSGSLSKTKPLPPNFGTVPVMIAVGTGTLLGWRHHRNGSWNRAPVKSNSGFGFG